MISAKTDTLILLQLIVYHVLWAVFAYAVPRHKNRLVYYSAPLLIGLQMILAALDLPNPIYFAEKVILLSAVGICIDSVFIRFRWWQFNPTPVLIPIWLCFIWISFALSMQYLVLFIPGDFYVWAILGGIGFPLSYYVAQKLKVLMVPRPWPIYLYQGIFWLIVLPITL
jgi:hypothetical protein